MPCSYNFVCSFLVCDMKCGERGCVERTNNLCCHKQCLGGCSNLNSARHCYACRHLRMPHGECVEKCRSDLFEVQKLHLIIKVSGSGVPNGYLGLMIQLVKSKTFYDVKTLVKIPRPRLFLFYLKRERGIHTCRLGLHDSLQRIPIFWD